jgi:hypothetical protein
MGMYRLHLRSIILRSEAIVGTSKSSSSKAAIGFRAHSGWAALSVLSGPPSAPQVVDRRRIELCDPRDPHAKQPYHGAEPLEFTKAQKLINSCIALSQKLAFHALQAILNDLQQQGHRVTTAAILTASGRRLPDLKGILASHALIHAAEGEMFRDVLAHACEQCGLSVTRIREREVLPTAASSVGLSEVKLQEHLVTLGKQLGPPWTQDEKFATLAAWVAMTGTVVP